MTHFVPDERVDAGPVIRWGKVRIGASETLAAFESRMHELEHDLVVDTARILTSISPRDGKGEH
jgi:phosphoribosylglycinamide formyltransferase-1